MTNTTEAVLVVAAMIQRKSDSEKRILIVRRGPEQNGAGWWEFPGGKVEEAEAPQAALVREIFEELSLPIQVGALVGEVIHAYPTKTIRLRVYWAETVQEDFKLDEHDAFRWSLPQEINTEELSAADRPFVALINQGSK